MVSYFLAVYHVTTGRCPLNRHHLVLRSEQIPLQLFFLSSLFTLLQLGSNINESNIYTIPHDNRSKLHWQKKTSI